MGPPERPHLPVSPGLWHTGPMAKLRIATFNIENLFARPPNGPATRAEDKRVGMFQFDDPVEARAVRRFNEAAQSDDNRQLTAQAIIDMDADFVALQEVETEAALRLFRDEYLHKTLSARIAADIKRELPWLKGTTGEPGEHAAPGTPTVRDELAKLRHQLEARYHYANLRVVEGNDARGIDVGYLSRRRILRVSSNAHVTFREFGLWNEALKTALEGEGRRTGDERAERRPSPDDRVFRRDCLEVDIDAGDGRTVTAYICHFKANPPTRDATYPIRLAEALAVRRLIERRFGRDVAHANWLIAGDLNDYAEIDGSALMPDLMTGRLIQSALEPLVGTAPGAEPFAFDVTGTITDPLDRWTSYFARDDVYAQLDHILLSPALAAANTTVIPKILRQGQPYRAARYRGERYPRVGLDRPKASDHCPIVIDLTIP